jgi:hypothetical protein
MPVTITGGRYAIRSISAVGTTNVTIGTGTFVQGDFGANQRMVSLHNSTGVFKGIAWVRRWISATVLELEGRFVDPITGLFATQVVGDQILVSKNSAESAATGFTVATPDNNVVTVVSNFVDMLSHAKTEMDVVKELASDDKAYRSLTLSWFKNSPLLEIIQQAQKLGFKLIITTDHGTINVKHPTKVIGDKNTSLNLRYKTGRSLTYEDKDVYAVKDPKIIGLPTINMSSSYIFAKNDLFLAYVNNYNHYVSYYRNTYQHGGISLEEMIVPFLVFNPK